MDSVYETALGLDLSTKTGFAVWRGEICRTGVWKLKGDHGARFCHLRTLLEAIVDEEKPELLVIEDAQRFLSRSATQVAYGLRAAVMMFAHDRVLPVGAISGTEAKKHATGNGRADKPQMIAAAKERWPTLEFETDDAADAAFVMDLYMSKVADC